MRRSLGVAGCAGFAACLALAQAILPGPAAARAPKPRLDAQAVDTLVVRGGMRPRDVERWAGAADLADLVWILRRSEVELGGAEAVLARAAFARVPASRTALAARLLARAGAGGKVKRGSARRGAPLALGELARPRASAFRVGALLPDSGDYADYARSVSLGIEAGLESVPLPGGRSIEFEFWATGDDDPARVAAALEASSWHDGVLVGELLSVNTLALATGARLLGLPLLSPTATDEAVGTVGPRVFQVGPSGWSRGEVLARSLIGRAGLKVGALTSGTVERNALALGFLAAAESLGATVEWRSGYQPGTAFREEVKVLAARKLDVLLWDGEPREAEALVREMSRQKISVRLCGGEGLDPDRVHAESRTLLEGVRYVAEEWRLADPEQARLDSAISARGAGRSTPLHRRGWIAGRAIAAAVAGGALCPEEVAEALNARCGSSSWLASHRFLDLARDGATLPVFAVQRGRAVRVEPERR